MTREPIPPQGKGAYFLVAAAGSAVLYFVALAHTATSISDPVLLLVIAGLLLVMGLLGMFGAFDPEPEDWYTPPPAPPPGPDDDPPEPPLDEPAMASVWGQGVSQP
jgi:hypothetical protein